LLPLRMKLTARLKSAVAFGDGGPAGPNDVGAGHGAALPAAPAFAPALDAAAPPGAQLAAPAGVRADPDGPAAVEATGAAAPAAGSGAAVESGFDDHGIEAQPLNNATSATSIECRRHI